MSCFLCDSYYHVTQSCDKYISDKSQMKIIQSKLNSSTRSLTLFASKECYICCSRKHNSFFCPDRFTATRLFIPNIDHDLFPRFLATLDSFEKILLSCQSPSTLNEDTLKPLTIIETIEYSFGSPLMPDIQTNAVLCKNLELNSSYNASNAYQIFCERIVLKTVTVLTENIHISNCYINSDFLFPLLSWRTKKFTIIRVESSSTLDEIFKCAPNLEEFQFEFNTYHDHIWQKKNFFKYKYGEKFKYLKITVNDDFDVATLVTFLNKGLPNIKVDVFVSIFTKAKNARHLFLQKILNSFIPAELSRNQFFKLFFRVRGQRNDEFQFIGDCCLICVAIFF